MRKIISGAVLLIAGLAVTYSKGDIPPNLLSLMQTLFWAFVAGNGLEHVTTVIKDKMPPQVAGVLDKLSKENK